MRQGIRAQLDALRPGGVSAGGFTPKQLSMPGRGGPKVRNRTAD